MMSAPTLLASLGVKDLFQVRLCLAVQQNVPKSYPVLVLFFSGGSFRIVSRAGLGLLTKI